MSCDRDSSQSEYVNTLNRHWQQLDMYEDIEWKCHKDMKKYKGLVAKDMIYTFLMGQQRTR
jgi:hypothetical protein